MGFQVFVHLWWVILMFAPTGVVVAKASAEGHECRIKRCSRHGPEIRFPFWVKDKQPEHCGYPGFRVSCNRGKTLLDFLYLADTSLQGIQLFLSKEAPVRGINYTSQIIKLGTKSQSSDTLFHSRPYQFADVDPSFYSTNYLKLVSSSTRSPSAINFYPTRVSTGLDSGTTFFSCSSRTKESSTMLTTLSGQAFPLYYFASNAYSTTAITSCSRIFNSSIPDMYLNGFGFYIQWSTPDCRKCEAKGEYCKLMNNSTTTSNIKTVDYGTTCFPRDRRRGSLFKPLAVILPGGTLIVLLLGVLLYYIIRSYRQKKYDALKIEMFLTDYKAMKPTRYSYADIKKITGQFNDKLGQGGYGSVYKGQITKDIIVAVKVLNSDPKANGEDFINEVGTIGRIYHVNVVRLVGYCADGCNRALVYEFQPNNSLEKFTYSGKNHHNNFLGWEKMQEIALGIAKGIEYLHQGCTQQILHFDIKPHNILLDHNFNPKISDFGLAKLCSKDQSIVSMTMARGTIGYIAPEVFSRNFGKVSSKSDVYSFGMLLLEMVGARNNDAMENASETYFPEWIFHRLEGGGELTIQIEKEEDSNIAKKLTIVGLWCIGWHPVDRPSMKHVIHMLERQECPAMPPYPFRSSEVSPFTNHLQVISESE